MSDILRDPEIAGRRLLLRGTRRAVEAEASVGRMALPSDAESLRVLEQMLDSRMREIEEAGERKQREAYDAAYAAGFEEGRQKGAIAGDAEGREAYASGLRQLETLAQNLNHSVQHDLDEAEDLIVSLVFESVCKIVGDALATRDGVAAVVTHALGHLRGKPALVIRVNPLDLELLDEGAAFGVSFEADWRADDTIPMGGCIVESEHGTLDARIDTQLNQLKRVLLAARHKPADQRSE